LKQLILKETHDTPYSIHPGGTKMYQDLKLQFWWHGMNREIAFYIARCDVCQRVKAEHQRPVGLLQPLKVPMWKWEEVRMDFITPLGSQNKTKGPATMPSVPRKRGRPLGSCNKKTLVALAAVAAVVSAEAAAAVSAKAATAATVAAAS
jgi:hypothetical protein